MLNTLLAFKDSVIQKLGPVLGYGVLILGAIVALGLLIALAKTVLFLFIWLVALGAVAFGAYKIYELITAKKGNQ